MSRGADLPSLLLMGGIVFAGWYFLTRVSAAPATPALSPAQMQTVRDRGEYDPTTGTWPGGNPQDTGA
jgi:hypothetical protein